MKFTKAYILWVILWSLNLLIALIFQNGKFDNGLTVTGLIESYGYPVEIHEIVTEDRYILRLQRIGNKVNNEFQNPQPILFIHDILNSAADFVNLDPENALSFLLVDQGYDVWLLNARGTTSSRKHQIWNPDRDQQKFWNFSIDEIALYDTPKSIDYILDVCEVSNLQIVTYSQGGLAVLGLISEKPQYAKKIRLLSTLALPLFFNNVSNPLIQHFVSNRKILEKIFNLFNIQELFSKYGFIHFYLKNICREESWFFDLCLHHFFSVYGYNYEQINKTLIQNTLWNFPGGISSRELLHFLQLFDNARFEKYDYGLHENLRHYGNESPPEYHLSKATMPVAIYYSLNDWLTPDQYMDDVKKILPNIVKIYQVPDEKFSHYDFLHAKDVRSLLYNSVIKEIKKY